MSHLLIHSYTEIIQTIHEDDLILDNFIISTLKFSINLITRKAMTNDRLHIIRTENASKLLQTIRLLSNQR